jgi:pimeloyl-ACP methyl ester carboxylesterase
MLHGVYGRGRNWQPIAKALLATRPEWGSLLMDLRLHGQSVGEAFEPPHTLMRAAEDVQKTAAALAERDGTRISAVLGHSFGGKVALACASLSEMRQIWVIDSTPEVRAPAGSAWNMLEHVRALPSTFATRGEAVAGLEAHGWKTGVATWMATNLRFEDGQYRWTLDFEAMEALLRSFFETDLWPVVEEPPGQVEIHFVKAEESHTLSEEACARIQRAHANGRVHLHRVAGGHWLNTDNPQAIIALLGEHLPADAAHASTGG